MYYGKKELDIDFKPIRLYDDRISFHEQYRTHGGMFENVSFHELFFKDIYKIEVWGVKKYKDYRFMSMVDLRKS